MKLAQSAVTSAHLNSYTTIHGETKWLTHASFDKRAARYDDSLRGDRAGDYACDQARILSKSKLETKKLVLTCS